MSKYTDIWNDAMERLKIGRKSRSVDMTTVNQQLNNNSVNFVNFNGWVNSIGLGRFSRFYLRIVLNKVYEGLNSVNYYSQGGNTEVTRLSEFLNDNIHNLLYYLWQYGYAVVDCTEAYYIPNYQYVRLDTDGEVITPKDREWVVFYSNEYLQHRQPLMKIIEPILRELDTYSEADKYLTETFGAVCVMSGRQMPVSAKAKEELEAAMKSSLGVTRDKSQFIISQGTDLELQQFSFDLQGLDINGKIDRAFNRLCSYYGVPVNLLYTNENSTYDNQKESRTRFYTGCISNYAEQVLSLGRGIIKNDINLLIPSDDLSFKLDNWRTTGEQLDDIAKMTTILAQAEGQGLDASALRERINQEIATL